MNWEGFFPRFWEESAFLKLVNFMRGGNPFFSIKRVSSPHAPLFPNRTTTGLAALWTLAGEFVLVAGDFCSRVWDRWWKRFWRAFLLMACVTGLDVRHGCASVPCLDYVTGLDVGNGSDECFCWCFWEHSLISIILCIFMEIFLCDF